MHRLIALAALTAAALVSFAGRPEAALAHARFEKSEPAANATVASAPSTVRVWFTEDLKSDTGTSLKVVDATGQQVDNNDSKIEASGGDRDIMSITLKPNLPAGKYTVQWQTVSSEDGHAANGNFSFTVGSAAPAAAPAAPAMPAAAPQAAPSGGGTCSFALGFKMLHDLIPSTVGDCLGDEWHDPDNGDALQQTTSGLLVWRKADNWTAFTDGNLTWINGPQGLQSRPNGDRFPWETPTPPSGPPSSP